MDAATLNAAAQALRDYRTANGAPREGFDAAARMLTLLACNALHLQPHPEAPRLVSVAPGSLERNVR